MLERNTTNISNYFRVTCNISVKLWLMKQLSNHQIQKDAFNVQRRRATQWPSTWRPLFRNVTRSSLLLGSEVATLLKPERRSKYESRSLERWWWIASYGKAPYHHQASMETICTMENDRRIAASYCIDALGREKTGSWSVYSYRFSEGSTMCNSEAAYDNKRQEWTNDFDHYWGDAMIQHKPNKRKLIRSFHFSYTTT
jgi:hypothetical protein